MKMITAEFHFEHADATFGVAFICDGTGRVTKLTTGKTAVFKWGPRGQATYNPCRSHAEHLVRSFIAGDYPFKSKRQETKPCPTT